MIRRSYTGQRISVAHLPAPFTVQFITNGWCLVYEGHVVYTWPRSRRRQPGYADIMAVYAVYRTGLADGINIGRKQLQSELKQYWE